MNVHEILSESKTHYLYEGLSLTESRSLKLWENAGRMLVEYQLSADQINQLFQQVEKGTSDAGNNRTMLGKGKDVAGAVKTAYDDLVSKVQNSGPVKNIDAKYDQAAEKLKQATGGDAGVMKYVEKYRAFAKKHPVAQGLIYSALIAAAGISGVGVGGAAALGLLKMTDKLLQGEKFSTAVGKGAATGALAYGASQLADLFKGSDAVAGRVQGLSDEQIAALKQAGSEGNKMIVKNGSLWIDGASGPTMLSPPAGSSAEEMLKIARSGLKSAAENIQTNSKKLTEGQIYLVFNQIVSAQLDEGVFDKIKTIGKNLTTKVTVDKLNSAWKKAGSPLDSNEVVAVLRKAGVSDQVLAPVLKSMKIKMPQAAVSKLDDVAKTDPSVSNNTADNADTLDYKSLQAAVAQLRTRDAKSLVAHIDKIDGVAQANPAATLPKATVSAAPKIKIAGQKSIGAAAKLAVPKPVVAV
jgi:hypothetical protein